MGLSCKAWHLQPTSTRGWLNPQRCEVGKDGARKMELANLVLLLQLWAEATARAACWCWRTQSKAFTDPPQQSLAASWRRARGARGRLLSFDLSSGLTAFCGRQGATRSVCSSAPCKIPTNEAWQRDPSQEGCFLCTCRIPARTQGSQCRKAIPLQPASLISQIVYGYQPDTGTLRLLLHGATPAFLHQMKTQQPLEHQRLGFNSCLDHIFVQAQPLASLLS